MFPRLLALTVLCTILPTNSLCAAETLDALAFGLRADGITDDGPAIQRLLKQTEDVDGAVVVKFPKNKVIVVKTAIGRYIFPLFHRKDLTIEGGGCEFRLDPHLRFMEVFDCQRLVVRNLKIDYEVQPTAPGTIIAVNPRDKSIDVKLDWPDYASKLGGPTRKDGEQAFFGMILRDALYGMTRVRHFYVDAVKVVSPGVVRIRNGRTDFHALQQGVTLGRTRIGLPVPGVAHRCGPGALFIINHSTDVTLEDIEVWSAPWFAFQIFRNEGQVVFRDVNVRPRPGSGKVLSSCRDAIHAKGNRATLLFERCVLKGLGDDAFNISTHCSRVRKVDSPMQVVIGQHFPIQFIPMRKADTLVFLDPKTNRVVGESKIAAIRQLPGKDLGTFENHFKGRAPQLQITLAQPIGGLENGLAAWARETANPKNILRNCTIRRSCRFQSNVLIEGCDVEAFMWFYAAKPEGPGPEHVTIRNSTIKSASLGRTLEHAATFSGWEGSDKNRDWKLAPTTAQLKDIRIENNTIWGKILIRDALKATITGNTFHHEHPAPLTIEHSGHITTGNNTEKLPTK